MFKYDFVCFSYKIEKEQQSKSSLSGFLINEDLANKVR